MEPGFSIWEPLAGIGLFLFAMKQIEAALQQVSGRGFRQFIRRNTDTPLQGVVSGTLVTAIVQSSSLVGLMMLALVGAGVVQMRNALAVIFGANLGTTATGWIVALIGFRLDLDALAFPLVGICGVVYVSSGRGTAGQFARFGLNLGLLLMGLNLMKSAVDGMVGVVSVESLQSYSAAEFLLFGALFSAIVQSSSATMAVALSALYGGMIDLPAAAAVAIGADLGTTSTVMLGAINGSAAKKRVAAGHFGFNLVTDVAAFAARMPLLALIAFVGITDELLALVAFHSLFNAFGLALFLPVIGPFARLLESRFADSDTTISRHVGPGVAAIPEAAMEALELETAHLLRRVIDQNMLVFDPPVRIAKGHAPVGAIAAATAYDREDREFAREYQKTKQLEGEILGFSIETQTMPLDETQSMRVDRCQRCVREAVHSSKSLKDIAADLQHFDLSGTPALATYAQRFRDVLTEYFLAVYSFRQTDADTLTLENIIELNQLIHRNHDQMHRTIYSDITRDVLNEEDISSLLNVNREVMASCRSLTTALAAYVLDPEQLRTLEELPGSVL